MKVLHVVPSMTRNGGGPSESVPMTAMAQKAAGLDVGIAYCETDRPSLKVMEAEAAGVRLHRFRGTQNKINPIMFSWDLFRHLECVAREYDVVHIHMNWLFPVWWAAHVARKLRKPYVMMPRGSFAPERLCLSRRKKRLVSWLDRYAARRAAAFWATAEKEAAEISTYIPGAKVEVLPIGLDVGRYADLMHRSDGFETRTLLYFSRISPIKGLDMLAEAWSLVQRENENARTWCLRIVGPDDRGYRAKIADVFAAHCPQGTYEFRDPVYGEDKRNLLAEADAFVLPTRNENWGIAVAEAMASGLPVICTKGAPWSCLETEGAGWWTEVSVTGLVAALDELISSSDEDRAAMGNRARQWAVSNLDWAKIAVRMRTAYAGMCEA